MSWLLMTSVITLVSVSFFRTAKSPLTNNFPRCLATRFSERSCTRPALLARFIKLP